jgi:hypothetical protein
MYKIKVAHELFGHEIMGLQFKRVVLSQQKTHTSRERVGLVFKAKGSEHQCSEVSDEIQGLT